MNEPLLQMTAPSMRPNATLWFSVYAFGWGYRAFSITYETIRARLGARDMTDQQIGLAFESSRQQILEAVKHCGTLPYEGQRIALHLEKL